MSVYALQHHPLCDRMLTFATTGEQDVGNKSELHSDTSGRRLFTKSPSANEALLSSGNNSGERAALLDASQDDAAATATASKHRSTPGSVVVGGATLTPCAGHARLLAGPPTHTNSLLVTTSSSETPKSLSSTALHQRATAAGMANVASASKRLLASGGRAMLGSGSGASSSRSGANNRAYLASDNERHKRKLAKARERRATLILGLIMATFICSWLPFFTFYVVRALCITCRDNIPPRLEAFIFWMGYCNSAINPIIYTIFNRDFRKAFRKILFKCV